MQIEQRAKELVASLFPFMEQIPEEMGREDARRRRRMLGHFARTPFVAVHIKRADPRKEAALCVRGYPTPECARPGREWSLATEECVARRCSPPQGTPDSKIDAIQKARHRDSSGG